MFRAELDALPIREVNDFPHCSANAGVSHKCGHDGHMAIMLGVAKNLVESGRAEQMHGTVKFIFQPAEETLQGARAMIEAEVM